MLYEILVSLFVVCCLLLIFLILLQKGKSSLGLGSLGGGTQMLFGGSGGQDLFQKTTWILGTIFMVGSLVIAMMKRPSSSSLLKNIGVEQSQNIPMPQVPVNQQAQNPVEEI